MDPSKIQVFVVDDHELVRRGLIDLISCENDLSVVGSASNFSNALIEIETCSPQVAVIDVRLPDGSGIELCAELIARKKELKVIILTSFWDDEVLMAATLNGASAFLIKDIMNLDLLSVIRRVGLGEKLIDPILVSSSVTRLRLENNPVSELLELTDQEFRVVKYIGLGMTNRQIGAEMFLAEKTIKNYVSSLLRKLKLDRRSQVAGLAVRLGLTRD